MPIRRLENATLRSHFETVLKDEVIQSSFSAAIPGGSKRTRTSTFARLVGYSHVAYQFAHRSIWCSVWDSNPSAQRERLLISTRNRTEHLDGLHAVPCRISLPLGPAMWSAIPVQFRSHPYRFRWTSPGRNLLPSGYSLAQITRCASRGDTRCTRPLHMIGIRFPT